MHKKSPGVGETPGQCEFGAAGGGCRAEARINSSG